jgi:anti-sigma factor RsiW
MNCNEIEILLADYLDQSLAANEASAVAAHLSECAACRELAQDATLAVTFMGRAESVDAAPSELVNRILFDVTSADGHGLGKLRWSRRFFGNWMRPVFEPRLVMGMAMTALSLGMLLNFIPAARLSPVKVWSAAEDQVIRLWDQGVKFTQTVPVVVQVQSRYQEWSTQQSEDSSPSGEQQ